jgi:hypothetical protein
VPRLVLVTSTLPHLFVWPAWVEGHGIQNQLFILQNFFWNIENMACHEYYNIQINHDKKK